MLTTNNAQRDVLSADISALLGYDAPSIAYDPERSVVVRDALASLDAGLARLLPRQRQVLAMRYGMDGQESHTLDEIARAIGVPRERIRQIQFKAERILRQAHELRDKCAALMDGET